MKTKNLIIPAIIAVFFFAGCKREEVITKSSLSTQKMLQNPADSNQIVYTPFGPRKKSEVHAVEEGYHLNYENGRLKKFKNGVKTAVEDFGVQISVTNKSVNTNKQGKSLSTVHSPSTDGWVSDAVWTNSTGYPINYFSTSWRVPSNPPTSTGQVLFFFNGLEDYYTCDTCNGHILQPVLQYGNSGSMGGNYWIIDNWYASCQTCPAFYGTPVTVTPNTLLQGVMKQTLVVGTSNFEYNSSFTGYPTSNQFPTTFVPELKYAFETFEAYNVSSYSNYPADLGVQMQNIEIKTNNTDVTYIGWQPNDIVTNYGQHSVIFNYNAPGGEVDLYFYQPPIPVTIAEIDISKGDSTFYWSRAGQTSCGTTLNSTKYRAPAAYTVATGESYTSITGIGISAINQCYYWYSDGKVSIGSTTNASSHAAAVPFTVPSGETIANILSISINKSTNGVYTWYKDGKYSTGTYTNLGAYTLPIPFTAASGETIAKIVGIGIAGSDGYCYAWYNDRRMSAGSASQLDSFIAAKLSGF